MQKLDKESVENSTFIGRADNEKLYKLECATNYFNFVKNEIYAIKRKELREGEMENVVDSNLFHRKDLRTQYESSLNKYNELLRTIFEDVGIDWELRNKVFIDLATGDVYELPNELNSNVTLN